MWQRFKGFFSREEETDKPRPRARPKPRQEWLVAVGQGQSPARTLRRESRSGAGGGKPRRKKFDTARLSFGGLEQEQEPRQPQPPSPADETEAWQSASQPTTPSPRTRKKRPDFSPSAVAEASTRRNRFAVNSASPRGVGRDATPGGSGGGGGRRRGSPSHRPPALEPTSPTHEGAHKTDWLAAAVAAGNSSGGGSRSSGGSSSSSSGRRSGGGGGGICGDVAAGASAAGAAAAYDDDAVDAKLNSLLVLSPGKEYWAGRLARKGPRQSSESAQTATAARKHAVKNSKSRATGGAETTIGSPREVSPLKYPTTRKGESKNAILSEGVDTALVSPREVSPLKYPARRKERGLVALRSTALGQQQQPQQCQSVVGGGSSRVAASSKEVSPLKYPARRKEREVLALGSAAGRWQQQQDTETKQHQGASTAGSSAGTNNALSPLTVSFSTDASLFPRPLVDDSGGGGSGSPVWSAQAFTSPSGVRGLRERVSPWRALEKGEVWSPSPSSSLRQFSPTVAAAVSWSPVKGQRRRGFIPTGTRGSDEEAVLAASPRRRQVALNVRDSGLACPGGGGGYSSRGRTVSSILVTSPSILPTDGGSGTSRDSGGSERQEASRSGDGARDSSEGTREFVVGDDVGPAAPAAAAIVLSGKRTGGREQGEAGPSGGAPAGLDINVEKKLGETTDAANAAAKPETMGSRKPGPEDGESKEVRLAMPPPATDKYFIGFLPEEFCAPFRLLFQMFAVAGWP